MNINDRIYNYSKIINEEIKKLILKNPKQEIYTASNHLLNAGGKNIRSSLMLLMSDALCGKFDHVLLSSITIEVFHAFTLIHDDIIDHSKIRRSVSTVHEKWGLNNAILAGDLLYLESIKLLLEHYNEKINSIILIKIINSLIIAGIDICEGQWMDVNFKYYKKVTEEQYFDMIKKKTAILFATSMKIVGLLNNVNQEILNKLYNFGLYFGIAFQLKDDILDITSNIQKIGKDNLSDIKEKKITLMIIHAFKESNIFLEKNNIDIIEILDKIQESKSIDYVKKIISKYIQKCKVELSFLKESKYKDHIFYIINNIL